MLSFPLGGGGCTPFTLEEEDASPSPLEEVSAPSPFRGGEWPLPLLEEGGAPPSTVEEEDATFSSLEESIA